MKNFLLCVSNLLNLFARKTFLDIVFAKLQTESGKHVSMIRNIFIADIFNNKNIAQTLEKPVT